MASDENMNKKCRIERENHLFPAFACSWLASLWAFQIQNDPRQNTTTIMKNSLLDKPDIFSIAISIMQSATSQIAKPHTIGTLRQQQIDFA